MEADNKKIEEIKELARKQPWALAKVLQKNKKYTHLNIYVLTWTEHLSDIPYSARVYYAINKLKDYVKCANPNCANDLPHSTKFKPLEGPYIDHCCMSCAHSNPIRIEERRQRSIERCGYPSTQATPEFRKKMSDKLQSMPRSHWDRASNRRVKTCRKKYYVSLRLGKSYSIKSKNLETNGTGSSLI